MARLIYDAANQYDDGAWTYDGSPVGGNTPWVWPVGHDIPDLSKCIAPVETGVCLRES